MARDANAGPGPFTRLGLFMTEHHEGAKGTKGEATMRDFSWIAQSRKAQVALGAVVSIVLVRVLRRVGLSDQDAHDVVAAVLVIGATWIGSIAIEDHGEKQKSEVRVQSSATSIDQQNAVSRPSGGPDGAAAGGAAAP